MPNLSVGFGLGPVRVSQRIGVPRGSGRRAPARRTTDVEEIPTWIRIVCALGVFTAPLLFGLLCLVILAIPFYLAGVMVWSIFHTPEPDRPNDNGLAYKTRCTTVACPCNQ